MATVTAPSAPLPSSGARLPERARRLPAWAWISGLLAVLLAASAVIRTRYIGGQFWMDEALSVGVASHPLSAIPGVLRQDGSPPLYYLLLHGWMAGLGAGETVTHALSLLFALLTIPVGMWAGWSLFGRRAGVMTACLFAFSAFLTQYSTETRMYTLVALLGLLATASYLHAFVFRRRRYLVMFAVSLALMLYTHAWTLFFLAGALIALIPLCLAADDRRGLLRDAVLGFGGAVVLFAPWLPNFVYQLGHSSSPWDSAMPRVGINGVQLSRDLLGGDRVTAVLLVAAVVGLAGLFVGRRRATRETSAVFVLVVLPVATLALAWLAARFTPAWASRDFAPVLAPLLLLAAFGCSRAGIVGVVAIVASLIFVANPGSYTPPDKSDMRDVGGELTPLLHPGDLVVVGQPEQVPLAWYYLPAGLRYADTLGWVSDPRYMNWAGALSRLQHPTAQSTLPALLASLKPGQQVLFVRPLTEGAQSWAAPWTMLVRRRSAQWGAMLSSDASLKPVAWAPHNYRPACCVADSALLYEKVS